MDMKTQITIAQIDLLQNRIIAYANKLWQLPFSYMGIIAVSGGIASENGTFDASELFVALGIVGIIVGYCMYGAKEGYARACNHLSRLENEFCGQATTEVKSQQTLPYFLILAASMCLSVFLAYQH